MARVVDGVRCLNVENTELVALLSEKVELLDHALNRWADFQKLYTELKNINDWFAEKEEALNRFQRIVTQREFEIALEDVKVSVLTQKFSRKHYSSHFKVFAKKKQKKTKKKKKNTSGGKRYKAVINGISLSIPKYSRHHECVMFFSYCDIFFEVAVFDDKTLSSLR